MDNYEVLKVSEQNDDTEVLFNGYKSECNLYLTGYIEALLHFTPYAFVDGGIYQIGQEVLHFHSPLVSQYDFTLEVAKYEPDEEVSDWDSPSASNLLF